MSVALIFIGVATAFSTKNDSKLIARNQQAGIKYQVNIHMGLSAIPCAAYLVKVVDETGRLVAPPQVFNPAVRGYSFNEILSTEQNESSRRIALLVRVDYGKQLICSTQLYTLPAIKAGNFLPGHLYIFDLYPKNQSYTLN